MTLSELLRLRKYPFYDGTRSLKIKLFVLFYLKFSEKYLQVYSVDWEAHNQGRCARPQPEDQWLGVAFAVEGQI